jgi:hypothetical protein
MAIALRIRRRLWVALAAIAASLPGVAGAATGARCEAMPAGCTACHCCEETSASAASLGSTPAAIIAPTPSTRGIVVGRPASSRCECRSQEPTAPAQRPGQREGERRVETGREVAADSRIPTAPRAPVAIAFMPDVGPPRSPLYLRTLRLLI